MKTALLASLVALSLACEDRQARRPGDAGAHADAARLDAGRRDAAASSTGDASTRDGAARDAGGHKPGAADSGELDSGAADAGHAPPPRTHGLAARVPNTTCFLNGTPPLDVVPVASAVAYPQLSTSGARGFAAVGNKLAVIESAGHVRSFDASGNGSAATSVLDLSNLRAGGLRAAVLRADGAALIASFLPADDPLRLVVARFAVNAQGVANLASQSVLLTLPLTDAARAGGALAFAFDGTLLVAFGDGGDSTAAADPQSLAGKLARIDVSGASGYVVPADNPNAGSATTLPEIYASGLGAPSACTVDRVAGHIWCSDAGDPTNDHLLLVTAGGALSPILSFKRVGCGAVVGYVSRDASLPDLQGVLVFGDACSATLQGMRFDGSLVRSQANIVTLPAALAGFGEDASGRMLAVDSAGAVHALVRPATAAPTFPTTVSATGCLAEVATRKPAAALVPFEVRTPLWSDGAKKKRYFVLPTGTSIGFTQTGAWQFPVGTIFMKEFLLDDDNDTATPDRIMETRFIIKRSDSAWEGYSFMWDRARKDAFLLEGSEIGQYAMQPGKQDSSGASLHRHTFPDRSQCLLCHNAASGRALGLQTGRMNTDHDYDGFVENQLQAMDYVGLFGSPLTAAPDSLPRFAQPADTQAPLEDRARSWLYANCSHCHRPGGPTPVSLDFRYETLTKDTGTCGVTPRFNIAQIMNAKILAPGDSAHSEMFFRLSRRDQNQMPPIATLIVDPVGVDAVQKWIDSLSACP